MNGDSTIGFLLFLNAVFGITMIIAYNCLNNRARLREQGFHEEYITYTKRTTRNALIIWVLCFLFVQVLLFFTIKSFFGDVKRFAFVNNVFFMALILVLPIRYIQARRMQPKLKELAIKTGSEIVIDFNYRILHKIFKPWIELPVSIAIILFSIFILGVTYSSSGASTTALYIYIVMGWFMYFDLRGSKNLNRPLFKSYYEHSGKFINIFHGFIILTFLVNIFAYLEDGGSFFWYEYVFMFALFTALLAKFIYYLMNYSRFKAELKDTLE